MASQLPEGSGDAVVELDTPDCNQTEGVVWSFMRHRFTLDQANDDSRLDVAAPIAGELSAAPSRNASNVFEVVGQQLAIIGDDVDGAVRSRVIQLARSLPITRGTAYNGFVNVCRKLFADGIVNWGRIAVLMLFGYSVAIECMQQGVPEFLGEIVKYLVKFIVTERVGSAVKSIVSWIAEQGGWIGAVQQGLAGLGATPAHLSLIAGLCITTVSAVILLRRS